METKIALPRLAQYLSEVTGKPRKVCEEFLKGLFRIIADELEKGEGTRVKGFGTFKLVDVDARKSVDVSTGEENEIPSHKKVIFVASKELAAKVNSPFEAFEAMEVADDLPTDILTSNEFSDETENEDYIEPEYSKEISDQNVESVEREQGLGEKVFDNEENIIIDSVKEDSIEEFPRPETMPQPETMLQPETEDERVEETLSEEEKEGEGKKSRKFGWGFVIGFVSAVILAMAGLVIWFGVDIFKDPSVFIAGLNKNNTTGKNELVNNLSSENEGLNVGSESTSGNGAAPGSDAAAGSESGVARDSNSDKDITSGESVSAKGQSPEADRDEVPTKPSDQPVYDTVSTTRYLTTIAKEHYGNFNLWPIIYEENKDILGHPDRIRPGTKVVVPSLKKYGIDLANREDVERMKKKGDEIYSKYKKSN